MVTLVEHPDTRTVRLPDGRILGYSESGAPDGAPVFVFHGLPGSRLQRHPDDSIVRRAGARFVHIERPGGGPSAAACVAALSPRIGRAAITR